MMVKKLLYMNIAKRRFFPSCMAGGEYQEGGYDGEEIVIHEQCYSAC